MSRDVRAMLWMLCSEPPIFFTRTDLSQLLDFNIFQFLSTLIDSYFFWVKSCLHLYMVQKTAYLTDPNPKGLCCVTPTFPIMQEGRYMLILLP